MNNKPVLLKYTCLLLCMLLFAGCTQAQANDPVPVAPATPTPGPSPTPSALQEELDAAPAIVVIYLGNQVYNVVPLKDQVVTVDQGNDIINEITVTGRGVTMSHSTCENQDCVQQGDITLDNYEDRILNRFIVCLPNSVTIEMVVKEDTAQ